VILKCFANPNGFATLNVFVTLNAVKSLKKKRVLGDRFGRLFVALSVTGEHSAAEIIA